jgi:hypothetical protein
MKKGAILLIKMKRSRGMNLEFDIWFDDTYSKLREVAKKHGFNVRTYGKRKSDPSKFADFTIILDDHSMLGLTLNPELSAKPFKVFPDGVDIGLNEIDEFLDGFEVARNTLR